MPDRLKTFQEVLTAAVADIVENGFDSQERIDRWTRELRRAAEGSMISPVSLEQQLRDALANEYRKMVDRGGVLRFNQGVERFTLERVRPALRAELDRRIAASANLIRLNRSEAIEKTLRRFQGWSTSVPPGGVSGEKRAEVKENVRKSLASLPFEERRVLIDQGHKLVSAINDIVASDGGAIAGVWRSNWRRPGYNYREDHKERDEKVFLIRDSWAHKAGFVKPGKAGYVDDVTAPAQEPFCSCWYRYLYALRELPEDMLTRAGREALCSVQGRKEVRSARTARADSVEIGLSPDDHDMLAQARRLDRLGYLAGVAEVEMVPDRDQWNAEQISGTDKIRLQAKFGRKLPAEKVQILLHEAGHRGQDVDRPTFEEFKRRHEATVRSFVAIANPIHLRDFKRSGKVDGLAGEVFAESYARACLEIMMPPALAEFWDERFAASTAKASQEEASYTASWHDRVTRCQRCSMFLRLNGGTLGNACRSVGGEISAHGHCKLFVIDGARADLIDIETPKLGAAAEIVRLKRIRDELRSMMTTA